MEAADGMFADGRMEDEFVKTRNMQSDRDMQCLFLTHIKKLKCVLVGRFIHPSFPLGQCQVQCTKPTCRKLPHSSQSSIM